MQHRAITQHAEMALPRLTTTAGTPDGVLTCDWCHSSSLLGRAGACVWKTLVVGDLREQEHGAPFRRLQKHEDVAVGRMANS